jgi:hypothetical protein
MWDSACPLQANAFTLPLEDYNIRYKLKEIDGSYFVMVEHEV